MFVSHDGRHEKQGLLSHTAMALAGVLNFLMPASLTLNPNCDFRQDLILGQEYYIYNTQYPGQYPPSTSCTWYGRSEPGTRIVLACEDIALPSSTNCNGDKLAISLSGDLNFADARNYCGKGTLSLVTNTNSIAVGLFSTWNSVGGRYICTMTAIRDAESSTTQSPQICDCGWRQGTRIVGGNETLVNEYPSMAGLVDSNVRDVICGGSIISDRYVLTAAHCLLNVLIANLGVLVGDHNISAGYDTVAAALYRVERNISHPNFNPRTQINDIAILRTTTRMVFSIYVGPACLPFRYTAFDFTGQIVTALGWGQLFFSGPRSDTLQKVDLMVTPNDVCAAENSDSIITANQVCTFYPGKDACQSDSGGPLLWMDTGKRRLQTVGVISYGLGCATDRPGINTRVTSYISWIVSSCSDAPFCVK
ncbi:unnamed protein product [Phaedon cochleariae]|uniref:Venom serine protease 34 n=1 Tax=Phaedon cochleariae TaxID=80249 RepID=A0A9P0DPQ5_PHACE|nr:unnamed protein product [Phaedon cochleariae]